MDRRRIRYIYEVIFGLCAMISCTVLSILIGDVTLASFILTIIIVCLSAVVKITLVDNFNGDIKAILNGVCLYEYNISISCFFILCVTILNKNKEIPFSSIWLYANILNLGIPIVVIWIIRKQGTLDSLINKVAVLAIASILFCSRLPIDISKEAIRYISYILIGASNILYIYLGRSVIYSSRYQGRQYYNIFLFCRLLEYISICTLSPSPNIIIICLNIEIVQMYFILKSALINCIDGPRSMTMTALEEVEVKIHTHNTANRIIVNLSHELKTPVNIIRSAADLLLLDCSKSKLYSPIIYIKEECIEIMNVIQLMIDIQKLKSGTSIIRNKVYNIVTIVENTIESISGEYDNVKIVFNPAEEEIFTNIDMDLFQQGLLGLFTILIQDKSRNPIYIDMKRIKNDKVYINIFSEMGNKVGELIKEVKDFKYQENIVGLLEIQYLQEILHMHMGEIEYINTDKKSCIEIVFPCSEYFSTLETRIDEKNVYDLKEKIRCSYLIEIDNNKQEETERIDNL